MKVWIRIILTAAVCGLLFGFALFCFHFFETQMIDQPSSLKTMMVECRAVPYGVISFLIMLVAEIAWYSDLLFGKNDKSDF